MSHANGVWWMPLLWGSAAVAALSLTKTWFRIRGGSKVKESLLQEVALTAVTWPLVFGLLPVVVGSATTEGFGSQPILALRWQLTALGSGCALMAGGLEASLLAIWDRVRHRTTRRSWGLRLTCYGLFSLIWIFGQILSIRGSALRQATSALPNPSPRIEVFFLQDGYLCTMRLWRGPGVTRLMRVRHTPSTRLVATSTPEGHDLALLHADRLERIVEGFAPQGVVIAHQPPVFEVAERRLHPRERQLAECFGEPARLAAEEQAWRIELSRGTSGAFAQSAHADTPQRICLDLPSATWHVRCGTWIQDRWLLLQIGPQICLWEPSTNKLYALCRGRTPLVVAR